MFLEKVLLEKETGEPSYLTREELREACPHKGIALVASFGTIERGKCSLVLRSQDFCPYVEGHQWLFPGHWQIEMAALTAGFQAMRDLIIGRDWETMLAYNLPMLISYGDWEGRPLVVEPTSCDPLIATVDNIDMRIGGRVHFTANVRLSQGNEKSALWKGIKVFILRGK